jgi:hypothetical protein
MFVRKCYKVVNKLVLSISLYSTLQNKISNINVKINIFNKVIFNKAEKINLFNFFFLIKKRVAL